MSLYRIVNYDCHISINLIYVNHICYVMISVLSLSTVDRGFVPRSYKTTDDNIGMCCFSSKHSELRSKSKDLLARNLDNLSEVSDIYTRGLLFQ
jgi:hypothetical protein